jgi:phage terminase large subunit GpA-like protein
MATLTAKQVLARCVKNTLAPREKEDIVEWCRQHVRLTAETSAEPGRYDPDRTPYLRRPLRMFTCPEVRRITLMCASQLGKSTFVDCCKMYAVDQAPGPAIVMYPTVDDAVDYNQDRFIPAVRSSPRMRGHLRESPRDSKNEKTRFDTCIFWHRGANAPGGRRGKPCRYVFPDEVQTFAKPKVDKDGNVRHDWTEVFERVKTFADHKIVCTSTPGNEGEDVERLYAEGSRERFHVPCPHCSHYQVLTQAQLVWEGGTRHADLATVKQTAHLVCTGCKGRIHDYHKPEMNARGVWVPESRTVAEVLEHGEGSLAGGAEAEAVSFQLGAFYSPFAASTLGDMAVAFVRAKRDGGVTKEYVNGWLGEPWVATSDSVEEIEIKRLCVPLDEGGYRLGEVPADTVGLVLSVDVQKDCLYVLVRAWGEFGRNTGLVWWQKLPRAEGRNLVELDSVPRVFADRTGRQHRVFIEAIDSGHFTAEVYTCVRRRRSEGMTRCYACKGSSGGMMSPPHRLSRIEKYPDGKTPIPGGIELLWFNTDYWADAIASRIKGLSIEPGDGEEKVEGYIHGCLLPSNEDGRLDEYLDHMTAEGKRPVRRGGQVLHVWEKRPGRQNHSWDAERQGFAAADLWQVRQWRKPAAARPPKRGGDERRGGGGAGGNGWTGSIKEQW